MNKFDKMYHDQGWGFTNNETLSGDGSTLAVNKYRNLFLSNFINKHRIQKVYDICGDCNWQHAFVSLVNVEGFEYFGFDVSGIALTKAKEKNAGNSLKFSDSPIDLCNYKLECTNPSKSLIIIKEVIQHLPLDMGLTILKNIKESGIKYLAVTNHDTELFDIRVNKNTQPGGFYPNNMYLEPFNMKNPIEDISDFINNKELEKEYGNLIIFDMDTQFLQSNNKRHVQSGQL